MFCHIRPVFHYDSLGEAALAAELMKNYNVVSTHARTTVPQGACFINEKESLPQSGSNLTDYFGATVQNEEHDS